MLSKCKTVLLLTDVENFGGMYKELASDVGVTMHVEGQWSAKYRVSEELIITSSKYLDSVNPSYIDKLVIILREGESPAPLLKKGVSRFIFDYNNSYELLVALFKAEPVLIHTSSEALSSVLARSETSRYCFGEYDFDFAQNKYKYKGKLIYLSEANRKYLAEWLLNGCKDNKKRMSLANMRKQFGSDFLRDVNRYGQYKEERNE